MSGANLFGTPASNAGSGPSTTAPSSTPASGSVFAQATGTPSFSFGNATPSGLNAAPGQSSGGGLFGNLGSSTSTQKPTGSLFGSTPANGSSSAPPSGGSLFSQSTGGNTGGNMGGGGISGAASKAGASLFGGGTGSSTPTTSAASPSISGATTTAPATGAFSSGGLFGITSSATPGTQATPAKPSKFGDFGSTTPAGAPPSDLLKPKINLFGASAPQQSSSAVQPSNSTGSIFGGAASTTAFGAANKTPASQPATAASMTTNLFGGASKPAETSTQKPGLFSTGATLTGTPGLFSGATTTPKPAAAASASGSSMFGAKPAATSASASSAPAEAAAPSMFAKPAATTASSTPSLFSTSTPATAATTTAPSLFGATTTATTTSATTTTSAATPSLFGAAATTTAPTSTSGTAASNLFGDSSKAPAAAAAASATASGPTPASSGTTSTMGPPSQLPRLKNKTMDEIITRWATDLTKYQKDFKDQAEKVASWDLLLVENGEKIQKLYLNTHEAEKASNEIDRQLQLVESNQDELEDWLDKYEQSVDDMYSKQMGANDQLGGPDQERERTYKLAETLTDRLDEMGRDLGKMINEINDISGSLTKGSKPDDPLSQIVRVLNSHLSQLQWIDTNAAALQAKVSAAQKASSNMGSKYGGPESDAAESFYRSFMGRR